MLNSFDINHSIQNTDNIVCLNSHAISIVSDAIITIGKWIDSNSTSSLLTYTDLGMCVPTEEFKRTKSVTTHAVSIYLTVIISIIRLSTAITIINMAVFRIMLSNDTIIDVACRKHC